MQDGKVRRRDVFNLWAIGQDLKSHVSVLALVGRLPETETREFVSKDLSMVLLENLGEKKKSQIIKELRNSILRES